MNDEIPRVQKDDREYSLKEMVAKLPLQFWWVLVHIVNTMSNALGDDFLSCRLRASLLRLLGIQLGTRTIVRGGSYFGGEKVMTGTIVTGPRCFINRECYFNLGWRITLGKHVVVSHRVTFISSTHEVSNYGRRVGQLRGGPIVVGDGTWIGANATILPGVTIGRGAIVAAGSVVSKDVPANVVVAGVPATSVKLLEALEVD
jgi:maltose O-acetyltransferase